MKALLFNFLNTAQHYLSSSPFIFEIVILSLVWSMLFFFYSRLSWATLALLVGAEAEVEEEAVVEVEDLELH